MAKIKDDGVLREFLYPVDKRLGRHVTHDPESMNFPISTVRGIIPTKDVRHKLVGPVLNQGQLGACHDAETEVLTDKGWKLFSELNGAERLASVCPNTHKLIYEKPNKLTRYFYEGDMYIGEHRFLNFKVTPNHRMVVKKWDQSEKTLSDKFEFVEAQNLGWYTGLLNRVKWSGDYCPTHYTLPGVDSPTRASQREPLDIPIQEWLKFLGIYIAEGTLIKPYKRTKYRIQIAGPTLEKKEFIRKVLKNIGVHALELKDRFTFENKRVFSAMCSLGLNGVKSPFKFVPEFIFDLPANLIKEFLLGHFIGDGCLQNELMSHYTSSVKLSEDLQRLIFLSGEESHISIRAARQHMLANGRVITGNYDEHRVSVCKNRSSSIDKKEHIRIEKYKGEVFCAEVPTFHTLVTRRHSKILISGNCTGFAGAHCLNTEHFNLGLKAKDAIDLYSKATKIDGIAGIYPPRDTGSSGLYVCKAMLEKKLIKKYEWAFGFRHGLEAIIGVPLMQGTVWLEQMMTPAKNGQVVPKGMIYGGHEYLFIGVEITNKTNQDLNRSWFLNSWGDGWGVKGTFWMTWKDHENLLSQQGDLIHPSL